MACSRSTAWAGQISPPVQRFTTSPGGRTAWLPQAGQTSGKAKGALSAGRLSSTTETICGMTSPARCSTTVSPMRTSLRAISSSLCRVACCTMTPPTLTGCITARGVSAPVRPTWISIRSSVVVACSAGNFQAMAQRGARPTKPSRRLPVQPVELVDDAVDVVGEAGALLADAGLEGLGGVLVGQQAPRAD